MAYVYAHRRADNGKIFYIGKGSCNRAWVFRRRNKHWNSVATKGVEVEILMDNLTDSEAFELEELLCDEIGYDNLTNSAPAGLGGVGKMKPWNKGKKCPGIGGRKPGYISEKRGTSRQGLWGWYLNTETGEEFGRLQDAADSIKVKPETLRAWLNGQNPNKSSIVKVRKGSKNT